MLQYLAKTFNKKWATMIELIAMMAIMGLWIWSMLSVIWSWTDFAKNTEDTIKAINLAREGVEGVVNWRNTNWLRFSSDKTNCWITKDYVSSCIGNTSWANDVLSWSYLLYTKNWAWYLSWMTAIDYVSNWANYRSAYQTWLDDTWFYTQTWVTIPTISCSSVWQTSCLTPFNREIQIVVNGTGMLSVTSVVRWQWKRNREVTLTTILTNWKSKF